MRETDADAPRMACGPRGPCAILEGHFEPGGWGRGARHGRGEAPQGCDA